ncbi:hypothetical protein ASPWEDRAFT_34349 [Aspergillus wentii DTO 134E9]|uniref:Uncharacterized protein n=1 Tax=Aspergillus wentii DTO 134E9 TaxID=1073089 RepID=A0A1L9S145_ASPWE|nr:uncharacterized protein ASPWEDRAFT_34349 [Aspergillus wentii DTO 134E9]OJJ40881.1 hypothetical protein ASPWEDRAFT_34349 [Aspergillus wentii DTO 134E9]
MIARFSISTVYCSLPISLLCIELVGLSSSDRFTIDFDLSDLFMASSRTCHR